MERYKSRHRLDCPVENIYTRMDLPDSGVAACLSVCAMAEVVEEEEGISVAGVVVIF